MTKKFIGDEKNKKQQAKQKKMEEFRSDISVL